jgi:hypothetical protein
MNQRFLFKTIFQVTLIIILGVGIVHANGAFLLGCCGICKTSDSHNGQTHKEHDAHHENSSPCHPTFKFVLEENGDTLDESKKGKLTAINFITDALNVFYSSNSNQYFAYLVKIQTKAPDVPLFLSNLSLLF